VYPHARGHLKPLLVLLLLPLSISLGPKHLQEPACVVCVCTAVVNGGYFYNGTTSAQACPANTYNPGSNRVAACFRCPSGLVSDATSDSKNDCGEWPLVLLSLHDTKRVLDYFGHLPVI
jgi:hypothetical protein